MKKFTMMLAGIALVSPAYAADMFVKAPTYEAYSWTGTYVGVNGGGGFGESSNVTGFETNLGIPFVSGTWAGVGEFGSIRSAGGFGGAQIGANWQAAQSPWVLGGELDLQGGSIRGSETGSITPYILPADSISLSTSTDLDWFGTARLRLGYAWDRFMLYATGGVAYANVNVHWSMADTFGFTASNAQQYSRWGYAAGGGLEYAFASTNWSAKLEYLTLGLPYASFGAPEFLGGVPSTFGIRARFDQVYQIGRIGLNYHF